MRIRKVSDGGAPDIDTEALLLAKIADALAHPARVRIFRHVLKCNAERVPVCNKDVVAFLESSQATVSQHISKLVQAGLLQARHKDTRAIYYANIGILERYLELLRNF